MRVDFGVSLAGVAGALPGEDVHGTRLGNERLADLSAQACESLRRAGGPELEPSTSEFPMLRIGVAERCILDARSSVGELAIAAGRKALRDAGARPEDIGSVIVSTVTPDRVVPAMATVVQDALGIPTSATCFDITSGCNGFLIALKAAVDHLRGPTQRPCVLIIGAEAMLRVLDAADRGTCCIFGDGAGAVVLRRSQRGRLGRVDITTRGEGGSRIQIRPCEQAHPVHRIVHRAGDISLRKDTCSRLRVEMEGRRVFKDMVRMLPEVATSYLDQNGLSIDSIQHFVFHQANARMLAAVARELAPDQTESFLTNISHLGNTTSASIPLLLRDAKREGRFRAEDNLLLMGFGTGYSIGAAVLEWD